MKTALVGCLLGYGTIIGAMLVPVRGNDLVTGRAVTVMNNGRNLYVSLFARSLEDPLDPEWPWPQASEEEGYVFANSTEFLKWVVTARVMNVDFSFFGGPGLPWVRSQDASMFTASNNAWCVVSGVTSNTPDGMPILFTRDIAVTNLNQLTGRIRDTVDKEGPFGGKAIVMIHHGGKAWLIQKKSFRKKWEDVLDNYDAWFGDHPVLRP